MMIRFYVAPNNVFVDARVCNNDEELVDDAVVTATVTSLDGETTYLDALALDNVVDTEYNYRGTTPTDIGVEVGEKYFITITAVRGVYTNTLETKVKAERYTGE